MGFAWRARRAVARLRRASGAAEQQVADALDAALHDDPQAVARWTQIEALRAALLRSDAEVTFRDYGAGGRLARPSETAPRAVTRTVQAVCRSSIPPHEGRVLYHLIRRFEPARCLELGTCLGLSAAYQAAALEACGAGTLVTLEGGVALARLAEQHLHGLGLPGTEVLAGPFAETLPAVLQTHTPLDFAFIDGHHDPAAMQAYFQQLAPHLADHAVLVFDDIAWTTGMRHAWLAIAADPRIGLAVDLLAFGIGIYRASA